MGSSTQILHQMPSLERVLDFSPTGTELVFPVDGCLSRPAPLVLVTSLIKTVAQQRTDSHSPNTGTIFVLLAEFARTSAISIMMVRQDTRAVRLAHLAIQKIVSHSKSWDQKVAPTLDPFLVPLGSRLVGQFKGDLHISVVHSTSLDKAL